jgi:hypothetical protein
MHHDVNKIRSTSTLRNVAAHLTLLITVHANISIFTQWKIFYVLKSRQQVQSLNRARGRPTTRSTVQCCFRNVCEVKIQDVIGVISGIPTCNGANDISRFYRFYGAIHSVIQFSVPIRRIYGSLGQFNSRQYRNMEQNGPMDITIPSKYIGK